MNHAPETSGHATHTAPRWQPLAAIDRRVLGVLVEKAKTTPDAYPMTLNSLKTGCNQKNNRYPLMEVEVEDVQESLDRLRSLGAVSEVQGSGRALKYRHLAYEWLGVEKVELAVMAELLLRGAQSEGDLRGRAARMEPIADLTALRPVLAALKAKQLVVPLTPEGRGHMLTHGLYEPRELEKIRRGIESMPAGGDDSESEASAAAHASSSAGRGHAAAAQSGSADSVVSGESPTRVATHPPASGTAPAHAAGGGELEALRRQFAELQAEVAKLRKDVDDLWAQFR